MARSSEEPVWSFEADSLIYLIGQSSCGKSTFLRELLSDLRLLAARPDVPVTIYYMYGLHSEMVSSLAADFPEVHLIQGLDEAVLSNPQDYFKPRPADVPSSVLWNLLICDDLGCETAASAAFTRFVTQAVHHCAVSCITTIHSPFFPGKFRKLQQDQASYFVCFRSSRALESICTLAKQLSLVTPAAVRAAYQHVCSLDFAPLVIDVHRNSPANLALLSHVLPRQHPPVVYET